MTDIIGTPLEHHLLGSLLRDPRHVRDILDRVTGSEFITPVLGSIFDGICHAAARGEHLSAYTIAAKFPDWDVHGIEPGDPHVWVDRAGWHSEPTHLADAIRSAALRTRTSEILSAALADTRDLGIDPISTITRVQQRLAELTGSNAPTSQMAKELSEILQGQDSYDWVIPGMLERGDRLIVTGNEGGGKTTFLRQLALCAAGGLHPFSKTPIPPMRVLAIDAENSERQWRRTSRWIVNQILRLGAKRNPAEHVAVAAIKRIDITRPADLASIHREMDRHAPDLLMIGPLYRLYPKAINTDDDAAPVLAALDTLRDRGVTLVMEAHAGKSTDLDGDRNMAPRGSSAFLGWPEFGFGLRQLKADPQLSSLVRWRGDRDERVWPEHLYRGGDLPWTPSAI